jgi:predicted transport protein
MLSEKQLEDIICKYPEILEQDLKLKGRQIHIYGKIMDILFEDKFGQKLIVELKKGPILRNHIGQIMEYEGSILTEADPTARVVLVGNRVPPNMAKALDHHGIEYKEISMQSLLEFLKSKNDTEYMPFMTEDNIEQGKIPKRIQERDKIKECSIDAFLNIVEDPEVLKRITWLRDKIKNLGPSIKEYARRWHWIMYKTSKGQFCGLDMNRNHFIVFINLPRNKFNPEDTSLSNVKGDHYVKIKIESNTDLNIILDYINKAYQTKEITSEVDFEKAALFVPIEKIHIDKAFELLKERGMLHFYTNANIAKLADLVIDKIYFKLKHEQTISVKADFIELITENPDKDRLPKAKYYYGYKNLQLMNQPIDLVDLQYFKTGNSLGVHVPGACIITDPAAGMGTI